MEKKLLLNKIFQGTTQDFVTSSANVGKQIETMLGEAYGENMDVKDGGMSKSERQIMTTYLQTLFTTTAKDLGVLPEQAFAEYGPKSVLTPADATRTAEGKLQVTSDRAKQLFSGKQTDALHMTSKVFEGDFASFMLNAKDSERFVVRTPLSQATADLLSHLGIPADDVEIQITSDRLAHPYNSGHNLTPQDWLDALNMPAEAEKAGIAKGTAKTSNETTVFFRKANEAGHILESIYRVSYNENRKDAKTRLSFVTAYYLDDRTSKPDVATAREVAGQMREALRRMRDSMPNRAYDAAQKRAVGFGSISETVSRSTKSKQGFPQGTIGEWFPDIRAIATWTGANRSTFLHETGHMFLDMRTKIAVKLKAKKDSGVELTKGEKHLLDSTESAMKWLGTDLESFSKMDVDKQRPMHEKFANSYVNFLLGVRVVPMLDPNVSELLCQMCQKGFGVAEHTLVSEQEKKIIEALLDDFYETPAWVFPILWAIAQAQNSEDIRQAA